MNILSLIVGSSVLSVLTGFLAASRMGLSSALLVWGLGLLLVLAVIALRIHPRRTLTREDYLAELSLDELAVLEMRGSSSLASHG